MATPDPLQVMRGREYRLLLVLAAFSDGIAVTPLVIVAVVVAYLVTLRVAPHAAPQDAAQPGAASLREGMAGQLLTHERK